MLNCICVYKVEKTIKCYDKGSYVQFPAKRLTSDSWSAIVNDLYNRPLPQRPYYYIHNINASQNVPTNPYIDGSGTDEGLDDTKYHLINIIKFNNEACNIRLVFEYTETQGPKTLTLVKELSEINKFDDPSLFDKTTFTYKNDQSN